MFTNETGWLYLSMNPQEYYAINGYFIYQNLIDLDLIDALLNLYKREIIPSKDKFFRQSTDNYEKYEQNKLSEFGFVKQAFLDIHDYEKHPEFSYIAKRIYCSSEIQNALQKLTGSKSFNLMQSMLFDLNAATPPHQDWWYLDTVPNGHLIGAWIALEDIDEKAGRFYVLPKSIHVGLHKDNPNLRHSQWLERIRQYVEEHKDEIQAPALKKGDVLFWNSRTIHGSFPTIDQRFSRKSLTAHYLPSEYQYGNLFATKSFVSYKTFEGMKYYRNKPDYSFLNQFKFGIKYLIHDFPQLVKFAHLFKFLLK